MNRINQVGKEHFNGKFVLDGIPTVDRLVFDFFSNLHKHNEKLGSIYNGNFL